MSAVTCLHYPAPGGGRNKNLMVMLPGAGMEAGDFAANGMVAAVHDRGLAVDIIAARPELDLYLDGNVAAALHRAVIAPAREAGYSQIWLLGISLGGMGALLYAAPHEARVEGIVLLAPFLGTPGTIAEVEAAGGLPGWTAGGVATAPEARMLGWLRDYVARPPARPKLYLGYGLADRFARGHRLLGACLAAHQVFTQNGGHDWETWLALWRHVLDEISW
jgi:pimeloyl-ACP methyl ester carboxylesterase